MISVTVRGQHHFLVPDQLLRKAETQLPQSATDFRKASQTLQIYPEDKSLLAARSRLYF